MNKRKMMKVIGVVVFLMVLSKAGLLAFEKAKTKEIVQRQKIEAAVTQTLSNEESQMNKHLFYLSTPIGSVGIF